MKSEKGVTVIVMILIVFILVAIGVLMLLNNSGTSQEAMVSENEKAIEMASEPVSTDTDLNTLEKELDDTKVGSPDEDVNGMLEEASTL